jgi:hypothetical protein
MRVLCPAHTILELAVRCFRNPNGGILTSRRGFLHAPEQLFVHDWTDFGAALAGSHCDVCVRGCLPFLMSVSAPIDGRWVESPLEAAVILALTESDTNQLATEPQHSDLRVNAGVVLDNVPTLSVPSLTRHAH